MLASPGNSPRHFISTPSTPSSVVGLDHGTQQHLGRLLMGPPPPMRPKRSRAVLDEDTYVAAIEKIIERDFFPDIPKLQDRLQWLEAIRSGDPIVIRDAQLNIIQRRRGKSEVTGTPASVAESFASPSSIVSASPALSLRTPLHFASGQQGALLDAEVSAVDTSVSLDNFLKQYTSEDNASFSKILDKVNKKRREKYRFLSDQEVLPQRMISDREQNATDGYGTSDQPISTLEGWSYKAKNLLMYDSAEREDAPLTILEKEEKLKNLSKEINTRSTRFHGKMFDSKPREEEIVSTLYPPLSGATPASSWPLSDPERARKKYDLEDLRRTPQAFAEKENSKTLVRVGTTGYNYVATPSPAPGVDESPFMTWGEIEGTPLRLETEDTPVGIGGSEDGPHFKISAPPSRDRRAHSLSRDAARSLREKSRFYTARSSPSPARGSASPALKSLSTAAQNFVRKAMAKSCASVDAKLRASYRASTTPGTPRMARNAVRFREGSINSREGSISLQSPLVREDSVSANSPLVSPLVDQH